MLKAVFSRIFVVKVIDPWRYKVPVIMAIAYLVLGICKILFLVSAKFILLSLITVFGIAQIAYLLNDWGDEKKDLAVAKRNVVVGLSFLNRIFLLSIVLAFALLPWLFFPYNKINIILLGVELFLFLFYALPPFRSKERPIAGILTDTLYAHVVPCLLAAFTFMEISNKTSPKIPCSQDFPVGAFLVVMSLWQFFLGIRNIFLHQLGDFNDDMASDMKTFVTYYGVDFTERCVKYFALPFEIIFLFTFLFILGKLSLLLPAAYLVFLTFVAANNKSNLKFQNNKDGEKFFDYRSFCYQFLDNFYLDWFPLAVLLVLIFNDWRFVFLFAIHVFLFRNIWSDLFKRYILK